MLVAEHGSPKMLARIGLMRALHRGKDPHDLGHGFRRASSRSGATLGSGDQEILTDSSCRAACRSEGRTSN